MCFSFTLPTISHSFLPLSPPYLREYSTVCIYVSVCVWEGSSFAGWRRRWEKEKAAREGKTYSTHTEKQSIYWNKTCCFHLTDKGRLLTTYFISKQITPRFYNVYYSRLLIWSWAIRSAHLQWIKVLLPNTIPVITAHNKTPHGDAAEFKLIWWYD